MDFLGIGIGPTQLLLILIVAFFVLGPERLPEVARQIARAVKTLRSYASDMQTQFGGEFDELREEFGSITQDLTAIQGNLRNGLGDLDSTIRSVNADVQSAVSDVASAVSTATAPGSETVSSGAIADFTPAAPVSTSRN